MKALILDTETTGLIINRTIPLDRQPSIIELYAANVDLKTGKIKSELELLIRPPVLPLPEKITKITGLTDADLAKQPVFKKVAKSIIDMIEFATTVIAHNASFDRDMLEIELERLGLTIKWPRVICTIEATVHLNGYRLNMANLYQELFNEKFAGAHRAKQDVQALLRCCVELYKRGLIR